MLQALKRGWAIGKESWAVLKAQPSLAVFPVISVLAAVVLTALSAIPLLLGLAAADRMGLSERGLEVLTYLIMFIGYCVCTFAIVFGNAALIACALSGFAGQPATVRSGLAAARRRLPQILGWSLLAGTVGFVLRLLQSVLREKGNAAGEFITGAGLGMWGITTFFAIPVVVTEGVGPIDAVKRSTAILRRTWGESLTGSAGFSGIMALLLLPFFGVGALGIYASASGWNAVAAGLWSLCGVYVVGLVVVSTTLNTIFRAGVYSYATTGTGPAQMDPELLQATFRAA